MTDDGEQFHFFPCFYWRVCFFIGGKRHFWNLFKTSPKFWGWKQFFGKYAGYWETPCFHGFLPESPPRLIKWHFESIPCRMRGYYFMAQLSKVTYGLLQWLSSHSFTTAWALTCSGIIIQFSNTLTIRIMGGTWGCKVVWLYLNLQRINGQHLQSERNKNWCGQGCILYFRDRRQYLFDLLFTRLWS